MSQEVTGAHASPQPTATQHVTSQAMAQSVSESQMQANNAVTSAALKEMSHLIVGGPGAMQNLTNSVNHYQPNSVAVSQVQNSSSLASRYVPLSALHRFSSGYLSGAWTKKTVRKLHVT